MYMYECINSFDLCESDPDLIVNFFQLIPSSQTNTCGKQPNSKSFGPQYGAPSNHSEDGAVT